MQKKQSGHPTLHTLQKMLMAQSGVLSRLQAEVSEIRDRRGLGTEHTCTSSLNCNLTDGGKVLPTKQSLIMSTTTDTTNMTQIEEEESGAQKGERKDNNSW
jgi:hypothetical protein